MMHRCLIYIIALLLFAPGAQAQQLAIKWGGDYKNRKNSYITKIVGESNDSYFAFRYSGGFVFSYIPHIWLDKYSGQSLQQEFSREMSVPTRSGEPVTVEDMINLKGNIFMIASHLNLEADKKSIFAYRVDTMGKVGKESREVDFIPLETRRDNRLEHTSICPDSSGIMFYHAEYDEKTGNEKLVCRVIDSNLKQLYLKTVNIPYKKEQVIIENGFCDSKGTAYVLLKIANIEKSLFKEKTSYAYLLLAIDAENKVREYDLSLGDRVISEINLKSAPGGDILLAGFYSNHPGGFNEMGGSFYIRLDGTSGDIAGRGVKDFDKDFVTQFMPERKYDKGRELARFKLNQVLYNSNGGITLLAEQTYEDVICFSDPRTGLQTCNTHYYFNDIIAIKIDSAGVVQWERKIPKQQETLNDYGFFSSYLVYQRGDAFYLLFNDDIRNFSQQPVPFGVFDTEPFNMTRPHKAQVALLTVDTAGTITKKPFFNSQDNKIIIRPRLSYQSNPDVIIIYGEYGNRFRLGKIIYKDTPDGTDE